MNAVVTMHATNCLNYRLSVSRWNVKLLTPWAELVDKLGLSLRESKILFPLVIGENLMHLFGSELSSKAREPLHPRMSEQRVLGVPRVHSIAYLVRVVRVIPWDVVINTFTRMVEGGAANHLPPLDPRAAPLTV